MPEVMIRFHEPEDAAALLEVAMESVAEELGAHRVGLLRARLSLHGQPHDAVPYSLVRSDRLTG